MSRQQKKVYIKNNFSKQCIIMLSDVRQSKCYKDLQGKTQKYVGNPGRKKHSCYICFDKFFTKEELEIHKIVHSSQNKNNTFADDNDDDDESVENSKPALEETALNINKEICEIVNTNMETIQNTVDPTLEVTDTNEKQDLNETEHSNYRCMKCEVSFKNQEDIKSHEHTQHWCKYHCRQCRRQFNTKGGFIVHVLQHNITNISRHSYKCSQCCLGFDDCFELQRHNIAIHNEVSKNTSPNVQLEQSDITEVIEDSNYITVLDPEEEQLKKDNDNPMTGNIPIYDCDICYDVFASQKSLNRHKALHRELEKLPDSYDGGTIVIQDNKPEVNPTKASDKNEVFTSETTCVPKKIAVSMTQLTPMYSGATLPSFVPVRPNILRTAPTQRSFTKIKPKIVPIKDATANSSDVDKSIHSNYQMSTEKQLKPEQVYPYLSKPEILPSSSPLLMGTPISTATMPPLQPLSKSQDSSKQSKISLATGNPQVIADGNQSQYMYVLCPQSRPLSGVPPQSGQTLMMNIPASSQATTLPFNQQVDKNNETIMSSSAQNQVNINQQINTGGISKSQDSSKQSKIPLPTGSPQVISDANQSQYMYVLCQQSGTLSGGTPQGGQTLMMNIPGSSSPSTTLPFNQKVIETNDTIVPSSGQNKVIINPQISTGGVVINRETGGLQGGSSMMDQNNTGNEQSMGGASVDGAPVFYILLPTGQPNQESAASKPKNIFLSNKSKTSLLKNQLEKSETHSDIKLKPKTLRIIRKKKSSLFTKTDGYDPSEPLVMPIITSVTGTTVEEEKPEAKEVNTDDNRDTQQKDTTELVMPIITSIGTVAEESTNTNEKIRTDPVSQYENEFAKFLQETEKEALLNSRKKPLFFKNSKLDITQTPSNAGTSNDDVIFVDDNSSSSEPEVKKKESNLDETSIVKIIPAVENSNKETKPKIFVKKLSDLVDITKSKVDMFMHCCLRCNSQFKDWDCLKKHVRKVHCMHACKFDMCLILSSKTEYDQHIFESHRCSFCGLDFRILAAHQRHCDKRKTGIQIQESSGHVSQRMVIQASGQDNFFVLANPETSITSEDTSCSQK